MGGDLPIWDGACSQLAAEVPALVVSVGYRLAPEHPFPAAVEDSFAALRYVAEHASEWNGDATRMGVMGASAGGNLAAVVAQRARDEGGPPLLYQVLVVPATYAEGEPTESRKLFGEGFGLDGRVADYVEKLLVAPDIVLEGRDVEVADQDRRRGIGPAPPAPLPQLPQELQLVGEFVVELLVRHIAACRDIEIMDRDARGGFGVRRESHGNVTGIRPAAHFHHGPLRKGKTGQDRDAVIALLTRMNDMVIAAGLEVLEREAVVGTLGFLQAQHVGPPGLEKPADMIDAQADRVDVPGRDGELHGIFLRQRPVPATTVYPSREVEKGGR